MDSGQIIARPKIMTYENEEFAVFTNTDKNSNKVYYFGGQLKRISANAVQVNAIQCLGERNFNITNDENYRDYVDCDKEIQAIVRVSFGKEAIVEINHPRSENMQLSILVTKE